MGGFGTRLRSSMADTIVNRPSSLASRRSISGTPIAAIEHSPMPFSIRLVHNSYRLVVSPCAGIKPSRPNKLQHPKRKIIDRSHVLTDSSITASHRSGITRNAGPASAPESWTGIAGYACLCDLTWRVDLILKPGIAEFASVIRKPIELRLLLCLRLHSTL
jgi:hypothetical protein